MPSIRRKSGKAILVFQLAAALTLCSAALLRAETGDSEEDRRYSQARLLHADLRAVPKLELTPRQYLLVADTFQEAQRANPSGSRADQALLSAADLYAEMVQRFGPDPYKRDAIQAYSRLIKEYPSSQLAGRAREAIRRLGGDPPPVAVAEAAPPRTASRGDNNGEPAALRTASFEPRGVSSGGPAAASALQSPPREMTRDVARISSMRVWNHPGSTRIVLELDDYPSFQYQFLANPVRLYFDLFSSRLSGELIRGLSEAIDDPVVQAVRIGQNRPNKARIVFDLARETAFDVSWLANPPRMVIELKGDGAALARNESAAAGSVPAQSRPAPAPLPPPQQPRTFEEAFRQLAEGKRLAAAQATRARSVEQPLAVASKPEPQRANIALDTRRPAPSTAALDASDVAPVIPAMARVETAAALAKANLQVSAPAEENSPVRLGAPPKPADATSAGTRSLIRTLGLKIGRVVIDPGHGGHDTGTIGPTNLREKDVVLDISKRLARLVEEKLGAEVILTRAEDRFVPLSQRTAMANDAKADLFISVHANSSKARNVRGVETYYLNLTADPWALQVASRENAAANQTVHELQDLLSKIALKDKIDESREFATHMQNAVFNGMSKITPGLRNRGVRQAPFMVLIGAKMPAILAEIGFMSNPADEKLLKQDSYRQQVAEYLFDGIASYVGTLSQDEISLSGRERAALD